MKESVLPDFESIALGEYAEKAYLDYSMYVILDRALPHLGDGLKPVQRRIVYAMSELGLSAAAKFKKSARTVGDVLGKFHPHGDSACYEAMVLMTQSFSYRYPLIDGQGNWGSSDDPKSFAAMRYTEARLTAFSTLLLSELGQGTVDWQPNFDGTLTEPKVLPARVPHVLLNGSTGIAVGMSTDIPPHNLREVVQACVKLLQDPAAGLDDIFGIIQGPDFPTEAEIITPKEELLKIYDTGRGVLRMRAVYTREDDDIVIIALPYQASGAKVLEQIAQQMRAKKLPLIADLRDESDHENPTRLIITPRSSRVDAEELMSHLFATTDLEKTVRVNLNMIGCDGRPQVKSLVSLLREWLEFRIQTVRRRLQHRLDQVEDRLHILAGLLIAFLNIDEVIRIIRFEEDPKAVLIERFALSDRQAEAILNLRLRHLARLEEMKIKSEQDELEKERKHLTAILNSNIKLKNLIIKELEADAEAYGDARRSPVVARTQAKALEEKELVSSEPVTVVLSKKGWVRAAKGHDLEPAGLSYKAGDELLGFALGKSNQPVYFLDNEGRSYALPAHTLPSARGQGEPLTSRLTPSSSALFTAVMMGPEDQHVLLCSDGGYGFVATLADLNTKNKAGKAVLSVPSGRQVLPPCLIKDFDHDLLVALSNEGRLLVFPLRELPRLAKGKGQKIMNIKDKEEALLGVVALSEGETLLIMAGKRKLKLSWSELDHYKGERGKRGHKLPRGYQKVAGMSVDL